MVTQGVRRGNPEGAQSLNPVEQFRGGRLLFELFDLPDFEEQIDRSSDETARVVQVGIHFAEPSFNNSCKPAVRKRNVVVDATGGETGPAAFSPSCS